MNTPPLVDRDFLDEQAQAGLCDPNTLWDLVLRVPGDRTAIVCPRNGPVDYSTLVSEANGLAGHWASEGITAGDIVLVQLPSWYEFALAHLALTRLGAITLPLLPVYRERELGFIARASRAVALVGSRTFRDSPDPSLYDELVRDVPALQGWLPVDGSPSLREIAQGSTAPDVSPPSPDDVTIVMATSGTTGDPKLILHTHRSTVGGVMQQVSREMGLSASDVLFMPSPIAHATGLQYGVRMSIALGTTLILQERWQASTAARLIDDHQASFAMGATPFLYDLVNLPAEDLARLASLRVFVCGGAPIPGELAHLAAKVLPNVSLLAAWGMSETGVVTLVRPGDPLAKVTATDGRPVPGWEIRIANGAGGALPIGAEGEIECRGAAMFRGYMDRSDLTAEAVPAGWLRTGDIGVVDEDGYLRCLGRLKDLIIRGGLNISANEVEDLARSHPDVKDIAVVGLPDPRLGERVCAYLVPVADRAPSVAQLGKFLTERGLAKTKLPERVVTIDSLPVSPTGKVLKYVLRQQLAQEIADSADGVRSPTT
jgi:cyclohexanecarboxylate-CoA ligase